MINLESTECLFCNPENQQKMQQAVHLGKSQELAQLIRDIDQITPDEVQHRLDAMVSETRESSPVDLDYLPTNANMGFSADFRATRNADFFADKLGMTIEKVQKLYREDREEFYRLVDAQGLRIKVKPEDL